MLLRAISAAFAFVAFSDGSFDDSEEARFIEFIQNTPDLGPASTDDARALLGVFAEAFEGDFATGVDLAHTEIRRMCRDPAGAQIVVRAAQVAIVADERLHDAEETALARICSTLGVAHESH